MSAHICRVCESVCPPARLPSVPLFSPVFVYNSIVLVPLLCVKTYMCPFYFSTEPRISRKKVTFGLKTKWNAKFYFTSISSVLIKGGHCQGVKLPNSVQRIHKSQVFTFRHSTGGRGGVYERPVPPIFSYHNNDRKY